MDANHAYEPEVDQTKQNELLEKVHSLETKLAKDDDTQVEHNQMKKSVKIRSYFKSWKSYRRSC